MMWQPLAAGLYLVAKDGSFDARLPASPNTAPPTVGYQLVAGISVNNGTDVEQWNFLLSSASKPDAMYVPPHRRNIYVGERVARWVCNLDTAQLMQLLRIVTTKATLGEIAEDMAVLTRNVPLFGQKPLGDTLVVEYDPHRHVTVAWRDRWPDTTSSWTLQGIAMHEIDPAALGYGVAVAYGLAAFGTFVTEHSNATLQEVVTSSAIAAVEEIADAERGNAMGVYQAALLSAVHELFMKGGDMARRQVRDVSEYGDKFGFDTARGKPDDPFAAVEEALKALLIQAGSINEGGRNEAHVELFMERVFGLEAQLERMDERLQDLRSQLDLCRIAVGRQVMGAS